jgi:hypothetical protein
LPKRFKLGGVLSSYKIIAGRRFDYIRDSIQKVKKIFLIVALLLVSFATTLSGCNIKTETEMTDGTFKTETELNGSFDFVIYESDSDNNNLSDNKVVARYTINYHDCETVTEALYKKGDKYYFSLSSNDYLVLEKGAYGLTYTEGYFENYAECSGGKAIDVSWSYTAVNCQMSSKGISETSLAGLTEFGFVINGWK